MKINQSYIALALGLIIGLDSFLWASPKHFVQDSDSTRTQAVVDTTVIDRHTSNQTLFQQYFSKSVQRDTIFLEIDKSRNVERPSSLTTTLAATIDAGRTVANIDVTPSGGLSYSIPFDLPPGITGILPDVGLAYNSQGGNGIAGYGWNIVGMSAITRVAAVPYIDGFVGNINFDHNDRFALDGQRLLLKSGTYGGDGAEYQTENYSNIRIFSRGVSPYGASYGPAYFEVHHADGLRLLYGYTNDSRSRTTYALVASDTPQDIRINYVYSITDNTMYLDEINYGSKSSSLNINKIQFTYSTPTRRENIYIGGQSFTQNKVLSKVTIIGNGVPLRRYIPTYSTVSTLNYQVMSSLQEFNGDETKALTPINFSYNTTSNTIIHTNLPTYVTSGIASTNDKVLTLDYNGDGNLDFLLYPNSKTNSYMFSNIYQGLPSQYGYEITGVGDFLEVFPVKRLNATEIMQPGEALGYIKLNGENKYKFQIIGTNFIYPNIPEYDREWNDVPRYPDYYSECDEEIKTGKEQKFTFVSGDFNGDGLTEVFAIGESVNYPTYETYTVKDGCVKSYDISNSNTYRINLDRRITSGFVNYTGTLIDKYVPGHQLQTGDFNGDGKTDILHVLLGKMSVYSLSADGTSLNLLWSTSDSRIVNSATMPTLLGDYNGDGKMDIMFSTGYNNIFAIFISTGKGFIKHEGAQSFSNVENSLTATQLNQHFLIPNDIDGDGKTDIIYAFNKTDSNPLGTLKLETHHNTNISSSLSPVFSLTQSTTISSNIRHYPIPLFLSTNRYNPKLEFGFLSDAAVHLFSFTKDMNKEKEISSVELDYLLFYDVEYDDLENGRVIDDIYVYENNASHIYPYVDIHDAPGFRVVKRLVKSYLFQNTQTIFGYVNAVTRVDGLGFLGFGERIHSNWHFTESDPNRKLNFSIQDPFLRGATTKVFTSRNSWINNAIKSVNLSNPPPSGGISDGATLSDYMNRNDIVYSTTILPNKTFINVPAATAEKNMLDGTFGTTVLQYDAYYNPTKTTNNINGLATRVTDATFDNYVGSQYYIGRLLSSKVTITQGSESFSTKETYSYAGYLPNYIYREGNATATIMETLEYDTFGNVISRITSTPSVPNRTESMEYDVTGRFMTKYTDSDGLITSSTYSAQTGNVLTTTDPYNRTDTYSYDTWGRQITKTDYLSNTQTTTYTKAGPETTTTQTSTDGASSIVKINAIGQKVEILEKTISGAFLAQSWTYDGYERLSGESAPSTTGTYSQWNTTTYDNYDRVSQVSGYSGKTVNYTYSGLSIISNDGVKTITTVHDALGRVTSVTDPGGTVNYTYFPNGNLKTTNFGGSIQTIEQNGWGEKTKLIDPSAGEYNYSYDGWGQLTSVTTPKGTTTYNYDAAGKVTAKSVIGSSTNMSWTYTYNPTTKLPTQTTLVNADGNNTTLTYSYDAYKRLSSTIEDNPYATFSNTLTYNSYGRVATEAMQATDKQSSKTESRTVTYSYQNGELLEVTLQGSGQTLWRFLGMDTKGMINSYRQGANIQTTLQYDAVGYPQQIKVDRTGGSPATLMTLGYTFNTSRGFPTVRSNSMFSWNESFSYDNLDRLTVFNDNNGSHNQSYDLRGRITSNSRLGSYNYTGTSYQQLDLDLNPTADTYYQTREQQDISYSAFKSPIEIHEPGHDRYNFQYNSSLQRANMFYGGEQTDPLLRPKRKHYSESGNMEIHKDMSSGQTSFVFYLGGDAYSAPALWKETHSASPTVQNLYFLQRDQVGSIVLINDEFGTPVEKRQFDAWGNIVKLTDGIGVNIPIFVVTDRGYTGHEHLQSVGLIHMNARLYDPLLGRFLAPDNYVQDPLGTQNFNRYGYAMNNPLVYTDPSGEIFEIFGFINLFTNMKAGHVPNFWSGVKAFGVGTISAMVRPESAFKATVSTAVAQFNSLIGLFNWNWKQIDMSHKIAAGLFHYDNNRNFGKQLFSSIARNYQPLQQVAGYSYAQFDVITGSASRVDYFGGATFTTKENQTGDSGISLGNYISANIDGEVTGNFREWILTSPLHMHEYGHTFDSELFGHAYLLGIGIPSLLNANWTERRANQYAAWYFRRFGVRWERYEEDGSFYNRRK